MPDLCKFSLINLLKMKNIVYLPVFCMLLSFFNYSFAQDNYAINIRTTITDEQKFFINYDIVDRDSSNYFNVVLILTYEGQQVEPDLNNLYGSYGHGITPGNKVIYWNYAGEFDKDINKMAAQVFAYKENEPLAGFEPIPARGNFFAPCEIRFMNNSLYSDRYEWDFGDPGSGVGNTSNEGNPIHTFRKSGRYNVSLTAFNTRLNLENTIYETIDIKEYEPTVADFSIIGIDDINNQKLPARISFKNNSVNADYFNWDFGDPNSGNYRNTSTEKNPSHRYRNPGVYTIELTAKSRISGLSSTKTAELNLQGSPSSALEKYKKMKTVWLASTLATAGLGGILYLRANSLYNHEYHEATTTQEAIDIREKIQSLDKIYPFAFAAAVFSGIEVIIQSKKQADAEAQLGLQAVPVNEGGIVKLTYNF